MGQATPIEGEASKAALRRVGAVLLAVGLADIGWMIYALSSGTSYSSSFNVFAVAAGILLRRNSLRTARTVRFFASFLLTGCLATLLAVSTVIPFDLILVYLRSTPVHRTFAGGIVLVALLSLLAWVHLSLTAPSVAQAIRAAGLEQGRIWRHRSSGPIAGGVLALLLALVPVTLLRSDSASQAIARARAQMGPGHRYFVSSLAISRSSRSATRVRATVLAYTDLSIQPLHFEWTEPEGH